MINRLFKNKDVKVIILEVFLIALGLVGLTLGVKYIMNSIGINVGTGSLAIDDMNAKVSSGNLSPVADNIIDINTTSDVLRITFDVKGASTNTNTGNNIIYDVVLNLDVDCALKSENIKWNLYKNNNLLTSGTTSPKYDNNVLNGKITLTDTQQDLIPYSGTADKYVFILWMSDNCSETDITKCDLNGGLNSNMSNKMVSGNIDIRLNSGKKKINNRGTLSVNNGCEARASYFIEHLDDGSNGDSGDGVYRVHHDAIPAESSATGETMEVTDDYRYYGANPNNYICLDMEVGSTCPDKHLYRIIGSIYEELENASRLKVVKATPLTDGTTDYFSWNESYNNINNIWATVTSGSYSDSLTSGSTLMRLLNSGAWWNGTVEATEITPVVNFTNNRLSDQAKNYVTKSRYYLGSPSGRIDKFIYKYERGTDRYDDNRPLYWDGMVGLMYPSDYSYASGNSCAMGTDFYYCSEENECKNRNWIAALNERKKYWYAEWLITTTNWENDTAWHINPHGACFSDGADIASYTGSRGRIKPTFYLTKDTFIISGTGTQIDPYQIIK